MNANINQVMLTGNITLEPESRATASGAQVLVCQMASNKAIKDRETGEWKTRPNYVEFVIFGARAEALANILTVGTKVAIAGELNYESWEKNGQKHTRLNVLANYVDIMSFKGQGNAEVSEVFDLSEEDISF